MKTVGIIGGLAPESTVSYYKWINDGVKDRLGDHNNAQILINSVNFQDFVDLKGQGDWQQIGQRLADAARSLQRGGADFVVLATNTMHKVAADIESAIDVPFLHLADATAKHLFSMM